MSEQKMEMLDPKTDGNSKDIVQENVDKLKEIFPEIFTEDKIDFQKLKETLGDYAEAGEERYNFTWHGKSRARRIAQTPSTGTLRPCKEESKNWNITGNLFIEGDNLEVLKLLQKSYHKKIKMIYIDPPYNTGKEFIYADNYKDNLETYLKYSGQIDDEGCKFSSNTEQSGRYHTNWLNMMYPRLKLARNLLKDDGAIFISIDDNEQSNLKKICDEIFGEDNFLGTVVWKNATDNNPTNIAVEHEYILVYSKNREIVDSVWKSNTSDIKKKLIDIGEKMIAEYNDPEDLQKKYTKWFRENKSYLWPLDRYKYIDKGGVYIGSQSVHNPGREGYRYDICHPLTGEPCKEPLMGYRFPEGTMKKLLEDGKILFGNDETKIIELKVYAYEYQEKFSSVLVLDGRLGPYELKSLFPENNKIFTNPKSLRMLKYFFPLLLKNAGDIMLDFFSGSNTSAHAVIDLNKEDMIQRNFIQVQLPESCNEKSEALKSGYKTIADIGKERIRRAGEKIIEENKDKEGIEDLDIGFKVFKLDSSNIKPWDADFDNLENTLWDSVENIKKDRTQDDVLYELLLKYGLDLTLPIDEKIIEGKTVYVIGLGALVICLDSDITIDVVEGIGKLKKALNPEIMRVVFKDNGFKTDVVKTNAIQILKQYQIEDVKSL